MRQIKPILLASLLFVACPALSQDGATVPDSEAETDLEIVNGVPVNPELKKRIMESQGKLTVQELLELSNEAMQSQREAAEEDATNQDWLQEDPLGHLEEEMYDLVQDIGEGDTDAQTQAQGDEVVRKMDTLIALLEQASSASQSAAGQGQGQGQGNGPANGNNPADDSTLAAGPGGSGELNAAGEGNNRFEDLDPAQREAILRAQSEQQGFPAEFDALLAEYYQRLASERALAAEDDQVPADE
ncbi:MAG: hypothetical protein ACPGYV_10200 [Phycisphaeraceae bacterium]